MNSKHKQFRAFAIVAVLIMVTALLFLPQIQAINQTEQDLKNKANFLISTFSTAKPTITQTISNLQTKDIPIPQTSIDALEEAQVLDNQAITKNQQGQYSEAIDLAMQALNKLKETLTTINGAANETLTEQEAIYERSVYLQNIIDRNHALLQRYENTTNSALGYGINVTAINLKLVTIKTNLESARSNINQGRLDQAEAKINETQPLLNELTTYFSSLATTLKIEKIPSYINEANQNLATLREELNSVSNSLPSTTRVSATTAITQTQNSLDRAKQYLDNNQIAQTISELTTAQTNQEALTTFINSASPTPTLPTPTPTPTPSSIKNDTAIITTSILK